MRRSVLRMRKRFQFDEIDRRGVSWTLIVSHDATAGRGKPRPYEDVKCRALEERSDN